MITDFQSPSDANNYPDFFPNFGASKTIFSRNLSKIYVYCFMIKYIFK